eukprot:g6510.t1
MTPTLSPPRQKARLPADRQPEADIAFLQKRYDAEQAPFWENVPLKTLHDKNYRDHAHGFLHTKPFAFYGDIFPRPFEEYLCFGCVPVPLCCFLHCVFVAVFGFVELLSPENLLGGYSVKNRTYSNFLVVFTGFLMQPRNLFYWGDIGLFRCIVFAALAGGIGVAAGSGTPKEVCWLFSLRLYAMVAVFVLDAYQLYFCEEWHSHLETMVRWNDGYLNEELYAIASSQSCVLEQVTFFTVYPLLILPAAYYMTRIHWRCQVLFDCFEETVHLYERHLAEVFEGHDLV